MWAGNKHLKINGRLRPRHRRTFGQAMVTATALGSQEGKRVSSQGLDPAKTAGLTPCGGGVYKHLALHLVAPGKAKVPGTRLLWRWGSGCWWDWGSWCPLQTEPGWHLERSACSDRILIKGRGPEVSWWDPGSWPGSDSPPQMIAELRVHTRVF